MAVPQHHTLKQILYRRKIWGAIITILALTIFVRMAYGYHVKSKLTIEPVFVSEPQPLQTHIDFDRQATRQHQKVTLPDSSFQIDLPANTFAGTGTVRLSRMVAKEMPQLPPDKTLVSSVYHYVLDDVPNGRTPQFFQLCLNRSDLIVSKKSTSIYLYEAEKNTWSPLLTVNERLPNIETAKTRRAQGVVAIFADKITGGETLKRQIRVPAFLVVDATTGDVLLERNSTIPRPLASLTKLMTASVFLDNLPDWDNRVMIQSEDRTSGSRIYLKTGDQMTVRDLFHASLVRSANDATMALMRATGLSMTMFVERMNLKARALGMSQTSFSEPTGLSAENRTTPEDYLKLARYVLNDPLFRQVTTTHNYTITTVRGTRNRAFTIHNTNRLLVQDAPIILSKTGFTLEAGRCLMVGAKSKTGREVLAVVMGAKAAGSQYRDMQLLLKAVLNDPAEIPEIRF